MPLMQRGKTLYLFAALILPANEDDVFEDIKHLAFKLGCALCG